MGANLAHLQMFLTGGATNTNAAKSLGGPLSSQRVLSQTASAPTTITGVTIEDAAGNAVGTGTLTYTYSATAPSLAWTPPGSSIGISVNVATSGKYALQGASNGGLLLVDVVAASLPGSNQTNSITIANQVLKIFDDVSKAESQAGDTEYRCLFVKNTHASDTLVDVRLWRHTDTPGQDVMTLELDPAVVGDGITTGIPSGCLEASKAITNATWSASVATYTSTAHGYVNGDLVKVAGITPSGYNVTAGIVSNVTANTFDLAVTSNPGAYTSGGTAQRFDEGTAPTGVTFSSNAVSEASSLVVGDLAPSQVKAFWCKRVVPAASNVTTTADAWRIGTRAYI